MKTPEQMAKEWYWANLTEQAPVVMLSNPVKHPPCPRKAFLAGYQAAELKAKIEFAEKYDHKSPLQVIAAEYVKRRGTTGPLALLEENRFIDGYEAGLHASQFQWISVKERLPEFNVDVLIYVNFTVHSVTYKYCSVALFDGTCWDDDGWYSRNSVTHWMPLPKPPEEK